MRRGSSLLVLAIASIMSGCTTPPPPRPFDAEQIRDSGGVAYLWTAGMATQPTFSMKTMPSSLVSTVVRFRLDTVLRPGRSR